MHAYVHISTLHHSPGFVETRNESGCPSVDIRLADIVASVFITGAYLPDVAGREIIVIVSSGLLGEAEAEGEERLSSHVMM
jgi:hypothetical protein